MEAVLIDNTYLLEKFSGKGGWTYAQIPEIPQGKTTPFGWVRVSGTIDGVELKGYHLMPMGNGKLFLPVKAALRRQIGKKEGDYIHVVLYADDAPTELPSEIKQCMLDEPGTFEIFNTYPRGEQKAFLDWIYSAKTEATKADRIARMLVMLGRKERFRKPG